VIALTSQVIGVEEDLLAQQALELVLQEPGFHRAARLVVRQEAAELFAPLLVTATRALSGEVPDEAGAPGAWGAMAVPAAAMASAMTFTCIGLAPA